jgi:16S rRNA (guanine527-N7)-methyltransferase
MSLSPGSRSDEADDTAFRERLGEQAQAAGLTLDVNRIGQLQHYFRLLRRWNRTINLTALPLEGLPDRTLNRLFVEPLQAARFVGDAPLTWFDLGSGGGSPAIPLKIVRPLLRLTMVESRSRRSAFLWEAVRLLALTATDVMTARIEELGRLSAPGQANLITLRAVRVDEDMLGIVAALLKPNGRLLIFGSQRQGVIPGTDFHQTDQLSLFGGDSMLHVLSRVG